MHRARSLHVALALLALAGAPTACALYIEQPPPPSGIDAGPPPPPPPPGIDAGPPPPPPSADGRLQIPTARGAAVDLVRLFDDGTMAHTVMNVPPGTPVIDIDALGADMVSATAYTSNIQTGNYQILSSGVFQARCAGDEVVPSRAAVIEVPFTYATIQEAIDAASRRDVIYVHPGTYYEHIRLRSGVHLIGAGAHRTVIDGQGLGQNLIEFTGADGALVRGFTLRNVGARADGCDTADALSCSGDWFAAAVYGDGHDPVTYGPGCGSSVTLMHNYIEAADTGVMLYYYATAVVRNNVLIDSGNGVVANSLYERALVLGNTFAGAQHRLLGANRAGLHAINNVLASAPVAVEIIGTSAGELACNMYFDVDDTGALPPEEGDNIGQDPEFRDPAARDYRTGGEADYVNLGCYEPQVETWFEAMPGAYGSPLGAWFEQDITLDDVLAALE